MGDLHPKRKLIEASRETARDGKNKDNYPLSQTYTTRIGFEEFFQRWKHLDKQDEAPFEFSFRLKMQKQKFSLNKMVS